MLLLYGLMGLFSRLVVWETSRLQLAVPQLLQSAWIVSCMEGILSSYKSVWSAVMGETLNF